MPVRMGEHDRFQKAMMLMQKKVLYFTRVYASHSSTYEFVHKLYLKNEEVLLKYEMKYIHAP